jgi:peptidoglycan/LPS O-acetylase OafA/YrhL
MAAAILLLGAPMFMNHASGQLLPFTQLFGFPAIALVCGLIVLLVVQSGTLLTNRPLRFLGRYSYGMYIWHFLVLHVLLQRASLFAPQRFGGSYLPYYAAAVSGALAATILVALVSWQVIEQPFLRLKRFMPYAGPAGDAPLPAGVASPIASSASMRI